MVKVSVEMRWLRRRRRSNQVASGVVVVRGQVLVDGVRIEASGDVGVWQKRVDTESQGRFETGGRSE